VVEQIIRERGRTAEEICADLKAAIVAEIEAKRSMTTEELLNARYAKFRKIGA